jgi:hypothetical protein
LPFTNPNSRARHPFVPFARRNHLLHVLETRALSSVDYCCPTLFLGGSAATASYHCEIHCNYRTTGGFFITGLLELPTFSCPHALGAALFLSRMTGKCGTNRTSNSPRTPHLFRSMSLFCCPLLVTIGKCGTNRTSSSPIVLEPWGFRFRVRTVWKNSIGQAS